MNYFLEQSNKSKNYLSYTELVNYKNKDFYIV